MTEVVAHALRVERRSLIAWTLGFALTLLMYLAFYPSIADSADAYQKAMEGLPEGLRRLSGGQGADPFSPTGYLQGQFFATFGFILMLVFAVGRGARAIAGDERNGLLELILSTPKTRTRLIAERVVTLAVELALLGVTTFLVLLLLGPTFDLGGIGAGHLAVACLSMVVGALVFGLAALAAGALTGEHGVALGTGSALAAAGFLYTTLSPLVGSLADQQPVSPCWQAFGYRPLVVGLDLGRFGILLAEAVILIAVAIWGFSRRDVH